MLFEVISILVQAAAVYHGFNSIVAKARRPWYTRIFKMPEPQVSISVRQSFYRYWYGIY